MGYKEIDLLQFAADSSGSVDEDEFVSFGVAGGHDLDWELFGREWAELLSKPPYRWPSFRLQTW
jgi:hypothetical protein